MSQLTSKRCVYGEASATGACVACDAQICDRHHGSSQLGAPFRINRALKARCVPCAGVYGSEVRGGFVVIILALLSVGAVFSRHFLALAFTVPSAVWAFYFFRARRRLFVAERDQQLRLLSE